MFYLSKFRLWIFSKEEKKLLNKNLIVKKKHSKSFSIIQCPNQEIFFNGFKTFVENDIDRNFRGIHPRLGYPSFYMWVFFLPNLLHQIHLYMIRRKWTKIYSSIGINGFFKSDKLPFSIKVLNFWKALKYFVEIRNKKFFLRHRFKDILCGDLIYDSYLRYHNRPTLNLNDPTLIIYIQDCYNQICYFEYLTSKYTIKNYYSSYSTYISHGIPVRVFLKNGVQVYSCAYINEETYNFKVKKLSLADSTQIKPHWRYKKIYKSLENHKELSQIGLKKFKDRFKGISYLDYMKENQFSPDYQSPILEGKYDGVVFIGDFFDSQHIFRSMVFNDLYEWLIHTIKLTLKHNLNIGFKEHPNQLPESGVLINKIKKKYPSINWINAKVSNNLIFNSGIKFGVSVYGSVIPELAFHKIIPICSGDNPTSEYNFSFRANNKKEYDSFILGYKELKFDSNLDNQLGEFYYMNMLHQKNLGYSEAHQKLFNSSKKSKDLI